MEDEIMDIIYDSIKDNKELKSAKIEEYKNLLGESVIKIKISKKEYVITCEQISAEHNYNY